MPFDHYIPASYLGRFSSDEDRPRRRRRLWVADRQQAKVYWQAATKICGARDFYSVSSGPDPRLIDTMWTYERDLNQALDSLIAGKLDVSQWLNTLVRFVAALLVRGPDFDIRFNGRFDWFGGALDDRLTKSNTHYARLFEWQRLLASIIGARWLLIETSGQFTQVTNDLGYTPFVNPRLKEYGIAIPVGKQHILLIIACKKRVIATVNNGSWVPVIERGVLDDPEHAKFLDSIALCAQRYVLGPNELQMRKYLNPQATPPLIPEPDMLGFMSGPMARHYEMLYFHCVTQFAIPPSNPDAYVYVDFEKNMDCLAKCDAGPVIAMNRRSVAQEDGVLLGL